MAFFGRLAHGIHCALCSARHNLCCAVKDCPVVCSAGCVLVVVRSDSVGGCVISLTAALCRLGCCASGCVLERRLLVHAGGLHLWKIRMLVLGAQVKTVVHDQHCSMHQCFVVVRPCGEGAGLGAAHRGDYLLSDLLREDHA